MAVQQAGYVDVPGGRLYYEVDGAGPPLTLIHAGVAHLRMWDAQVEAWRDQLQVVRYDTRGFGRTETDDVPYSNRDDLRRLLDHLGIERTHLLGASRGGLIGVDFVLEQPDRVRSLICVASGLSGNAVDDPRLADVWPEMDRLETARDWPALVELETRIWTDGPGQPPDRVDPQVRRQMVHWNLENCLADQQANQAMPATAPAVDRLSEIRVPTLVMWGTLDDLGVLTAGERLSREIPGARHQVFEGVAHMVSLERPSDFNRLVLDFVLEAAARPN
jgi:pimeloyl-ACP methyl ester carboxylesterase